MKKTIPVTTTYDKQVCTCDVCGAEVVSPISLKEDYQTSDIKEICSECDTVINTQGKKLLSMVLNIRTALLNRFIRRRRDKLFVESPKANWAWPLRNRNG